MFEIHKVMSTAFDADYITRVSVFGIDKLILQLTDAWTGPFTRSTRGGCNWRERTRSVGQTHSHSYGPTKPVL